MPLSIFDVLLIASDRYMSEVRTEVERALAHLPDEQVATARAAIDGALDAVQASMVAFEADVVAVSRITVD